MASFLNACLHLVGLMWHCLACPLVKKQELVNIENCFYFIFKITNTGKLSTIMLLYSRPVSGNVLLGLGQWRQTLPETAPIQSAQISTLLSWHNFWWPIETWASYFTGNIRVLYINRKMGNCLKVSCSLLVRGDQGNCNIFCICSFYRLGLLVICRVALYLP